MVQADLSGISYFLPILGFLIVWIIVYAVLNKTKIIEQQWLQIFVAFIFSTIFVAAVGPREYVVNITAWFAVFLVSLFLIMVIMGLVGKDMNFMNKGIGVAFVILVILMFIVSAIIIFSDSLGPYLPWNYGTGNPDASRITNWLYSERVMGAVLLIIVSAIVSWILVKAQASK